LSRHVVHIEPEHRDSVQAQLSQWGIPVVYASTHHLVTGDIDMETAQTIGAFPGVKHVRVEHKVRVRIVEVDRMLSDPGKVHMLQDEYPPAIPTSQIASIVGADQAWALGIDGSGVKVAILDSGIAPTAQGLYVSSRKISTIVGQPVPFDEIGHGTWMATCISGGRITIPSARVLQGLAPGAEIQIIKCLGHFVGEGDDSSVLPALDDAKSWGADIVSASMGGDITTDPTSQIPQCVEIEHLVTDNGVIVVLAAGNSGPDSGTIEEPGNEPLAVTVGAIDPTTGDVCDFSSRGPTADGTIKPDIVAPGLNITSSSTGWLAAMQLTDGDFPGTASLSGTSIATPIASAVIALGKQYAKMKSFKLTTQGVFDAMAAQGSKSNDYGWGMITFPILKSYIDAQVGG
jgi:subtilisin family serine protease